MLLVASILLYIQFGGRHCLSSVKKVLTEPFKNAAAPKEFPNIKMCPADTTTFITKGGEQLCCEGDVVDGKCNGKVRCGLIVRPGNKAIPSCAEYVAKRFGEKAIQFCPKTMTKYWEAANGLRGCTSGSRNADWSAATGGQTCKIYGSETDSLNKKDSCHLYKTLEGVKCPTNSSLKLITKNSLLACEFKDKDGIPRTCYDGQFMAAKFSKRDNVSESVWKEKLKGDTTICDVAKERYIDKIMPVNPSQKSPA